MFATANHQQKSLFKTCTLAFACCDFFVTLRFLCCLVSVKYSLKKLRSINSNKNCAHILDLWLSVNLKEIKKLLKARVPQFVRQPLVNSIAFLPMSSAFNSEFLYYLHVKVSLSVGTN